MPAMLIGKREGKRPLGIARCRWEANMKWMLKKLGMKMLRIHLALDRGQ
jgi:hypothetical protein